MESPLGAGRRPAGQRGGQKPPLSRRPPRSEPGLTVGEIVVAWVLGQPRLERGDDLVGGGSGQPKARRNEHHARVAFPAGCDQLRVERTEVAEVGRDDGAEDFV